MATVQTTIKLNDQFTSALKNMNKALNIMVSGLGKADSKTKTAFNPKSVLAMRSALTQSNVAIQNMTRSQGQFNKKIRESNSNARSLMGKLKSIVGVYAGFQTVKAAVGASDTYANNTARLGLLTGGSAETAALQQKIYEASQRSLTNYNDMTNAVAKLGITAKDAFSSNEEIVQFTELLNKQFKVAGTGAQEQAAAMYQLTQAMAAGKLQGDEFRSILENAPMLAQSIAKEMGVLPGQLKEMSSQGLITADIIKNALFNTADEVNEMYKKLPMTFGGMWTQVVNKVNKGLEGLWQKLGALWSSEKFQHFVDVLTNGFLIIGNAIVGVMDVLSSVFSFVYQYWNSVFEPILIAVTTVYIPILIAKLWAMIPPLVAQAVAWLAINWPILVIIAAVAALIAWVRYMGWTFSEVIGAICGAFSWMWAVIKNIFKGIANIVSGVCQFFVNSWQWCADNFSVVCSNIGIFFNNLWQSCTIAFYKFLNAIISGLEWLATPIKALAKLFGMDLGGAFDNMHAKIDGKIAEAESQKKAYGKVSSFKPIDWSKYDYTDLGDAYNKGYNWGSSAADKLANSFSLPDSSASTLGSSPVSGGLGGIGNAMKNANAPLLDTLDDIANNTANTADAVSMSNEDMSYLRELAQRDAINNISNRTVKVAGINNYNTIASHLDVDTLFEGVGKKLNELVMASADGSHF